MEQLPGGRDRIVQLDETLWQCGPVLADPSLPKMVHERIRFGGVWASSGHERIPTRGTITLLDVCAGKRSSLPSQSVQVGRVGAFKTVPKVVMQQVFMWFRSKFLNCSKPMCNVLHLYMNEKKHTWYAFCTPIHNTKIANY